MTEAQYWIGGPGAMRSTGLRSPKSPALHHGTDHRSQICTVLTTLGVEPPEIDVWDYGMEKGRGFETPPMTA